MSRSLPSGPKSGLDPGIRGNRINSDGRNLSSERAFDAHSRQHLTVAETAHALGVTVRVIHLRIKAGLIPATKLTAAPTSPYLIDAAVVEYMAIQEADRRARKEARLARRAERANSAAA